MTDLTIHPSAHTSAESLARLLASQGDEIATTPDGGLIIQARRNPGVCDTCGRTDSHLFQGMCRPCHVRYKPTQHKETS